MVANFVGKVTKTAIKCVEKLDLALVAEEVSKVAAKVEKPILEFAKPAQEAATLTCKTEIATLKFDWLKNAKELRELGTDGILELYATTLKETQKKCLKKIFDLMNHSTDKEITTLIEIVEKNKNIKPEEIDGLVNAFRHLQKNGVKTANLDFIHSIQSGRKVSNELLSDCYGFLETIKTSSLSSAEQEQVIDVLFGSETKNLPSIFESLGISVWENKSAFKRLTKMLGFQSVPRLKPKLTKLPDGTFKKENGFLDSILDFYGVDDIAKLPSKMKRNLHTIQTKVHPSKIKELPAQGISKHFSIDVEIDKGILSRVPQRYIDAIKAGEYDIKFLTNSVKKEDRISIEFLRGKYSGKDGSNIVEIAKGKTFNVELRLKDNGTTIADRLLGVYDAETKTIRFDTYSIGGLHLLDEGEKIFIGPQKFIGKK